VDALLAEQLSPQEGAQAQAHLAACADCRALVEAVRIAAGSAATLSPDCPPAAASDDPLVGAVLAQTYRVLRVVGGGGMGTVYAAEHLRLGRRVAVKVLGQQLRQDPGALDRFRREAHNCAALANPHIVDVLDFNATDDGTPFLVMELLVGEDLGQWLQVEGALHPGEVARIGRQICSALAAAHAEGIVHRDLKPSNVFLCRRDEGGEPLVKVLDFGLSKARSALASLTHSGQLLGTPHYMSPELARAEHSRVDHRSDLFSLGAILYESVCHRRAFAGDSIPGVLYRVVHEEPPPAHVVCPAVPPMLSALVAELLSKDPEQRPPGAAEVGARLAQIEAHCGPRSEDDRVPSTGAAGGAIPATRPAAASGSIPATRPAAASGSIPATRLAPASGPTPAIDVSRAAAPGAAVGRWIVGLLLLLGVALLGGAWWAMTDDAPALQAGGTTARPGGEGDRPAPRGTPAGGEGEAAVPPSSPSPYPAGASAPAGPATRPVAPATPRRSPKPLRRPRRVDNDPLL
jgi:serine/threonine-protein kinase